VLRPRHHAQGRNLFVVNNIQEVANVVHEHPRVFNNGWYLSDLIDKVAEYRVYVVNGMVATVASKTPDDPTQVAWNTAQGGRFDVVNWGDWPSEVVRVACEAFKYTDLDFGGVDVMVDRDGKAYVIEINSAPSLPSLSDGRVSYRQKCMAKCFKYMEENGLERMVPDYNSGWRGVIHPAVRS
jgi:glutathione synthase/RimK-type ligase-like ATP-grasp enzyme